MNGVRLTLCAPSPSFVIRPALRESQKMPLQRVCQSCQAFRPSAVARQTLCPLATWRCLSKSAAFISLSAASWRQSRCFHGSHRPTQPDKILPCLSLPTPVMRCTGGRPSAILQSHPLCGEQHTPSPQRQRCRTAIVPKLARSYDSVRCTCIREPPL